MYTYHTFQLLVYTKVITSLYGMSILYIIPSWKPLSTRLMSWCTNEAAAPRICLQTSHVTLIFFITLHNDNS